MARINHVSRKGDVKSEHRISTIQTTAGAHFARCSCGGYQGPMRPSAGLAKDDGAMHVGIEVDQTTSGMCATILQDVARIPSTVSHAIGAGRLQLQLPPDLHVCSIDGCGAIVDRDRAELAIIRTHQVLCLHHYTQFKRGKLPIPGATP